MADKASFLKALRPFSLVVAIATCGLGVSLSLIENSANIHLVYLVMLAGLMLQIAVNLINDYRDIENEGFSQLEKKLIRRNTKIGWTVMLGAIMLGLYMVSIRGLPLFILGVVGVFGAWGYTGGQINYKSRGLGVLLVFLFMGVLLVGGSYYAVSGTYNFNVFLLSLPFSLLSSLLLLSNELRDYEQDLANGIKTMSVRLGFNFSVRMYYTIVTLLYLVSVVLYSAGKLNSVVLILVSSIALWQPLKLLNTSEKQRMNLTALTGRFYFVYGFAYLTTIFMK